MNKQNLTSASEKAGVGGLEKVGDRGDDYLQKGNKSQGVCSQV